MSVGVLVISLKRFFQDSSYRASRYQIMGALLTNLLKRYWPSTLRMQLMIILLPVVGLPIVFTGYQLQLSGKNALIEEKRAHLLGTTTLLESYLQSQGGYKRLIGDFPGEISDREGQIMYLNTKLRGYTDQVAASFPGVGVGYFCLELNSIITYGPSGHYDRTVGMSIPKEHPGWTVMISGRPMTFSGDQVRGNIMNVMLPIKENGRVTGYIWANEFLDDIDKQANRMHLAVYSMTILGFVLSLAVVFFVIAQLSNGMEQIKQGLSRLRFNLRESIPPISGEIGEIGDDINELAQNLLETRSMHNNILDSLSDAVITIDMEGNVSYINPAGCLLLECQASDVIGASYLRLFRADINFSSLMIETMQSGREHRGVELDYPLPNRTPKILASTSRFFDGRSNQQGVVGGFRVISKTSLLREQVARADRLAAVGEMAAGIAHELRTPLTSIRGFVQYLQGSVDPSEWHEYGNIIIREVDGLNRIVSELLDLVRKQPLHTELSNLNRLIEDLLLLARDSASSHCVSFILNLSEDLPEIELDRGQIKQVLLNIIINAIQAISEEGQITITTKIQGSEAVCVMVEDTGSGMPKEMLERIFDPFFSTKSSGTGLGMTIAKRIIESHHGSIEITSVEGKGSCVTLVLPILPDIRKVNES